jgi:hypothetical protein
MALVYCDGFDTYSTAQLSRRYNNNGGSMSINSGGADGTGQYLNCPNDNEYIYIPFAGTTYGELYLGFDYKCSSSNNHQMLNIQNNGGGTLCVISNAGTCNTSYGNSSSTCFLAGQWYQVQIHFKISTTVGALMIKVNGVTVINLSGLNTGSTNIGQLQLGVLGNGNAGQPAYDNLWVFSTAGTHSNGFPTGRIKVQSLLPTSDGSNLNFTTSAGTTHYTNVNQQISDDDTTYNFDANAGDKDSYNITGLATSGISQVHGMIVNAVYRKDDINSKNMAVIAISGATETDTASLQVPLTYTASSSPINATIGLLLTDDPNTSAQFTVSAVNAMQIGVKVIS